MAAAPRDEPAFGDALAGASGMADPVVRDWSTGSLAVDVFPDALTAVPMPALPGLPGLSGLSELPVAAWASPPAGSISPAQAAASTTPRTRTGPQVRPSISSARQAADRSRMSTWPPPPATSRPAVAGRPPGASAPQAFPQAGPPGRAPGPIPQARASLPPGQLFPPSSQRPDRALPMPGQTRLAPGATQTPPGTLAPPTGRRPTAGAGYVPVTGSTTRSVPTRPPGYPPGRPQSAQRPPGRTTSIFWSVVVFAVIFLASTGLGSDLLHWISQLLQHRP